MSTRFRVRMWWRACAISFPADEWKTPGPAIPGAAGPICRLPAERRIGRAGVGVGPVREHHADPRRTRDYLPGGSSAARRAGRTRLARAEAGRAVSIYGRRSAGLADHAAGASRN